MTIHFQWEKIEQRQPLIHQITNYVTVNDCANVTLAAGASPVMAQAVEEVAEMARLSQALVLNIGTLDHAPNEAMIRAGKAANEDKVPVVLDPVGVGATTFRYESVQELLQQVHFSVIRGNASEISTICGIREGKGVDASSGISSDRMESIKQLAKELNTVIAVSGAVDYITDGTREAHISNGTPLLTKITGTGCMTTALIGCCLGAGISAFESAITSLLSMGIVGEWAEREVGKEDLGRFHQYLLNGFGRMNSDWLQEEGRINVTSAG